MNHVREILLNYSANLRRVGRLRRELNNLQKIGRPTDERWAKYYDAYEREIRGELLLLKNEVGQS